MAELAGREAGICRGRGGSMHLMGERAVMATGVVGGTLSIAVGHALAMDGDDVAVVFFGDGAVQTGSFHETMNMASLWSARVLFVCENNGWAEFSSRAEHTRVVEVASYGATYGIKAVRVDGSDVRVVADAARELLESIRRGEGPGLLECVISRLGSHYEGDLRRSSESSTDPVANLRASLLGGGVIGEMLDEIDASAEQKMSDALEFALGSPFPDPADDPRLVFEQYLS
jgi:TPP-dependent pyruvate/acetoin dehydrogenase alpha subunit